ncbi:hypothetical protein [Siansivirga zeaxanthinifaciens]|uniref:Outer membrane protein beta-barrel domain-containing protein n=1 Tax=Siansivirga zeaxanthinifaciens CC-SAMT-1 TaxID=1454006 RepID=A0A0C5WPE4_9FLAO|nr:hypothetical protein [Siansivirga zeaxanthinifaciens]AJR04760.1 hypothetical protein AW14_03410 [Siansivirga zeaxanthinifaciens CC-SAMT-1]
MSDKKHIDRLFQERFKEFEAHPSNAVWKNIEAALQGEHKKRRIIPIWWRYAGAAAILLLALTLGNLFFNENASPENIKVVDTKDLPVKPNSNLLNEASEAEENNTNNSVKPNNISNSLNASEASKIASEETTKRKETLVSGNKKTFQNTLKKSNTSPVIASTSEEKNTNFKKDDKSGLISTEDAKNIINPASDNKTSVSKTETKNTAEESAKQTDSNAISIEDALNKEQKIVKQKTKLDKWRVAPNVAPVYFNSLGEGSSIDPQLNGNDKSGEINVSYGITASYAINNKLKVRSGINKVNLGYNTNNVVAYQAIANNSGASPVKNINFSRAENGVSNSISFVSGSNVSTSKGPQSFTSSNTSINQNLGFIEVPLEIEYAISNNKLGINVIGGFSSFFLNDNSIYSNPENGAKTFLGEANNINKVSYSANFGLGLNYKLAKKLDFNLEPIFKYQLNTFNNTSGDFKPYFIGVYTGFAIKF